MQLLIISPRGNHGGIAPTQLGNFDLNGLARKRIIVYQKSLSLGCILNYAV